MIKGEKFYLVWTVPDDGDSAYWELFDSLQDAVEGRQEDDVEVYEVSPKLIGTFRLRSSIVKSKKTKTK